MTSTASARPLRILLVAYCFPPMNTTASHRPYGWARAWRDLGHEVTVLTPAKRGYDGPMDLDLDLSGIAVHEAAWLPSRRGAPRAASAGDATRRWERLKRVTRRARFSLAMFGDPRQLASFALVREGRRLLESRPADLIVATSPPEVAFFAARALSRRTGVPWVADFRDLWFRDMLLHQSRPAAWLSGIVHQRLARDAALLVTVSEGLQQRLAASLDREVLVSYNGYFERLPPSARAQPDDAFHIVYTGRVYPGKRDPEPLYRALAALRSDPGRPAREAVVDFYGFEEPTLRPLVERYRLGDCVRFHGFVAHRESLAAQAAADVLLFLDWTDTAAEGILTGKLFEYLASGRPILAVGNRADSEAARLIAAARCGTALVRHDDLVAYLRRLLEGPRPAPTSPSGIDEFSRERQARKLLSDIISRLPDPGRAAIAP